MKHSERRSHAQRNTRSLRPRFSTLPNPYRVTLSRETRTSEKLSEVSVYLVKVAKQRLKEAQPRQT